MVAVSNMLIQYEAPRAIQSIPRQLDPDLRIVCVESHVMASAGGCVEINVEFTLVGSPSSTE